MNNGEQNESSLIEDLPNELFVQIFSYLNGIDAVLAFSSLNHRFKRLLRRYCQVFDFKSKSKYQFDTVFDEHSTKNWKCLQLSNDENTPGQIEYCSERYPLSVYFPQLKSLSLLNINPIDQSIFFQLSSLTNLISLKIEFISAIIMSTLDCSNFKQLKRLVVNTSLNTDWINNFPQLENLEYTITNYTSGQTALIWPSTLKHLNIIVKTAENIKLIPQSLRNLSELITLKIYHTEKGYLRPDGRVWEQLIRSSFPLLKKFQFYFQFPYWLPAACDIEQIIASFSTPFYIDEKKWFVRCDASHIHDRAIIYSLPYAFELFTCSFDRTISTYPNDMNTNLYASIKTLMIESFLHSDDRTHEMIRNNYFNSIERLHLSTISSSKKIPNNMKNLSKKFCILLENTPHLYSLNIHINDLEVLTNNWTDVFVCNHLSRKIRSLKLFRDESISQYFIEDELNQIIRIFASECQHLSVHIPSPIDTVISILREMGQLYSLYIPVNIKNNVEITMKWIEQQHIGLNYSNCLIVNYQHAYYFWLGKRL